MHFYNTYDFYSYKKVYEFTTLTSLSVRMNVFENIHMFLELCSRVAVCYKMNFENVFSCFASIISVTVKWYKETKMEK